MQPEDFGTAPDGTVVQRVTLSHAGTTARLMTWGATVQDFRLDGVDHALVLGAPEFDVYPAQMHHFGAIAGPVANRIAHGRAPLDGEVLELERNENGRTMLHGGSEGTSLRNWRLIAHDAQSAAFAVTVPDGTGGLPGPMELRVTYALDDAGALVVDFEGETARPGFCNLAQHSYWVLDASGSIADHEMEIAADSYLPVDETLIPLGAPQPVDGTRFDFREARAVVRPGDALLDHNFCLRPGAGLRPVCWLRSDALELVIESDQPGLQVYDGSGMGALPGHDGRTYGPHAGVALEPQGWPDAPNHPDYPPITLRPGDLYRQRSRFHVRRRAETTRKDT